MNENDSKYASARKCREVICPCCDHRFMWLDGYEWGRTSVYRLVETGERLNYAKCPKCKETVVLIPHEIKGAAQGIDEKIKYESFEC